MNKYYSIVTDIGTAQIANAAIIGGKVLITKFVVGDGNGAYYQPTPDMTALRNQVWEGNVTSVGIDESNPNIMRITSIISGTIGGFIIREIGAMNGDGQLIAIANTPDMQKVAISDGVSSELEVVIEIMVSNSAVIEITVDPTVIIATKKDIQEAVDGLEKKIAEKAEFVIIPHGEEIPVPQRKEKTLYFKVTDVPTVSDSNIRVSPNMGLELVNDTQQSKSGLNFK